MRISLLAVVGLMVVGLAIGETARASVATVAGTVDIAAAANGGRIVSFSSEALDDNKRPIPEWQITNLIDGKYVVGNNTPADSYGWSSAAPPSDDKPEWFIVAFTDPATGKDVTRLISRIAIDPTTDDPPLIGRWVQGVTLQVSTTGKDGPWVTVGKYLVVNRSVKQTFDFPPTEARYVRLLITSNHGSDRCVEMGEFEVYEAIVPGEQLDELIIRLENLLTDLKRYRDGQLYKQQQETTAATTERPASPAATTPATPGTPATPTTPTLPTPPTTPATPPPGPGAAEAVNLGALSLVIPPGWTQAEEMTEREDDVKLVLRGPVVAGTALLLTVSVEPLEGQVPLADFVRSVANRWPQATFGDLKTVKLGEAEARYLIMTNQGEAYLSYCVVRNGKGITLTAVAPASGVEEAQKALTPLLGSVKVP
jgi:hypothetical protein